MWTRFMDMHSGGRSKEKWDKILIEAPEDEAKLIFYNRFGHNPERVTCTCCGDDYSISQEESLTQITAFDRGCTHTYFRPDGTECTQDEGWKMGKGLVDGYSAGYAERTSKDSFGDYVPLDEYLEGESVLVIHAKDIKPDERTGEVPEEGYVWV